MYGTCTRHRHVSYLLVCYTRLELQQDYTTSPVPCMYCTADSSVQLVDCSVVYSHFHQMRQSSKYRPHAYSPPTKHEPSPLNKFMGLCGTKLLVYLSDVFRSHLFAYKNKPACQNPRQSCLRFTAKHDLLKFFNDVPPQLLTYFCIVLLQIWRLIVLPTLV